MNWIDYLVLAGYFGVILWIGRLAMKRIKRQEDFLLGGRSFGRVIQAFAAFGAGTGSSDPVNTARTTFTSGMSGIWSVMSWLFVTPFYWIAAVWYRRMRHLTLGDWFVERYESKRMGIAYCAFGILFYMVYISMLFSAIGKVAAPLIGDTFVLGGIQGNMEYVLVPVLAVIVVLYGVFGGMTAAYWTDVVQGICIIVLSLLLIPFGLNAVVEQFGDPESQGILDGFAIMRDQLPESMFALIGSDNASEFPLHRIVAVTVILLAGVVVMPHFIATGGGSAKSESSARIGLVAGNLAKRFCTIGWALTALIVLVLYADRIEVMADPDKVWGVASRELLWPGLRGLMLACLLAALMSSVDCYMLVCSGLLIRNVYVPFVNPEASEKQCLFLARITGGVVVFGGVVFSLSIMDVFRQLQLTWIVPMIFAVPFWVGLYWRRATTGAAWVTIGFTVAVFFVVPGLLPSALPGLRADFRFTKTTEIVTVTKTREATPSDVRRRQAERTGPDGEDLPPLSVGDRYTETKTTGGEAIYWTGGVRPRDMNEPRLRDVSRTTSGNAEILVQAYEGSLEGVGQFKLDFLLFDLLGIEMRRMPGSTLKTLELLPKIVVPFLVMVCCSFLTRRNSREALDRYYAKMKTPVAKDPELDAQKLAEAYAQLERTESRKLFPGTDFEFCRPRFADVAGFLITFGLCFAIVWLAVWVANLGVG